MGAQNRNVTIQAGNITLKQVINEIEKQTNYLFVYDNADINLNKTVSVKVKNKKTEEVLTYIFKDTDITYTVENRNIMLMKRSDKKTENTNQKFQVKGTVRDHKGEPLIGVSVMEKHTQNGQITNLEGEYSIQVKDQNAVLLFSFIGFTAQEQKVVGQSLLNIVLQENIKILDEVVIVGYTAQKKGLLTGAISTMNVTESDRDLPLTSAGSLLVGKLPGVNVSTPGWHPGKPTGNLYPYIIYI